MAKVAQPPAQVSPALQALFVFGFMAYWSLMLLNIVLYLFLSAEYTDMQFWYIQTFIACLPGLMLAVAWWYVGPQKTGLNRLFLSSVVAFLGFMLTTVMQHLVFLVPTSTGGRVSETAQVVGPLVAFVLYAAVIVWAKKVKN